MIDFRLRLGLLVLTVGAGLAVPRVAMAAPQAPETLPQERRAVSAQPPTVELNQNATETRRDLYRVLDQYPPGLGRVLRLDPTLLTNPGYLAAYPNLAAFLTQHPDVPRNPGYYLERYESNYSSHEPRDAKQESLSMWRDALNFMGAFTVFCVVLFAFLGAVRYIVEYRRWNRVSRVNAEVHNKILDRFASNEELLAYVDSPAGRRFLEATPIAPSAPPARSAGAPFGRILLSVQIGIILVALAIGFLVISGRAIEEVQPVLVSLAVLGFCLGIGTIGSAAASYVLSRRLGLLPEAQTSRPEHVG